MALTRSEWAALGCAAAVAVAMPVVLLGIQAAPRAPASAPLPRTVAPPPVPPVAAIYERDIFAAAAGSVDTPADAPALVGIAGRLNRDAIAMMRLANGSARSLAVGESVDGWRLESLAIDAAFFTRGRERVRVAMAAEEPAVQ